MHISSLTDLCTEVCHEARRAVISIQACENLSRLLHSLADILQKFAEIGILNNCENEQHVLEELDRQLHQTRELVQKVCEMPWMFRVINAFQITTEFRNVCHSLGLTLEGLHALLHAPRKEEEHALLDDVKKLEWAFRTAHFPLERKESALFKESRKIVSQTFSGKLEVWEGVTRIQTALETAFGSERIKADWKGVAEKLFRNLDAARSRRDRMEEHYIRLLLSALVQPAVAPPEFYCPVNMEIMEDPVVLVETAVTCDRKSIDTWLYALGMNKCPVSGRVLTDFRFVENKPLKALIEDWRRDNQYVKDGELESKCGDSVSSMTHRSAELDSISSADVQPQNGCEEEDEEFPAIDVHRRYPWLPASEGGEMYTVVEEGEDGDGSPTWGARGNCLIQFKDTATTAAQRHVSTHSVNGNVSDLAQPEALTTGNPDTELSSIAETMLIAASTISDITNRVSGRRRTPYVEIVKEMLAVCQEGDIDGLQDMLADGWRLDVADEGGRSCVHIAAAYGQVEMLEYLTEREVDLNAQTKGDCATPLYMAAYGGHADTVRVLLHCGAHLLLVNKHGWSPLHAAADQGHQHVCVELLKYAQKNNIHILRLKTEVGWTALHHACRNGDIATTQLLLKQFQDVNERCSAGWTALHVAVDNGHHSAVECLLRETNANPNIQSKDGWTALHAAQDKDFLEIGRLLLKYGADPDVQGGDGATALHRAAFLNNYDFAVMLVNEGGADPNKKMIKSGRKALQIASDYNHLEVYNFLYWKGLQRMLKSRLGGFKSL